MKLLDILKLILGEAEQIVPIFVHNPASQKIEAIVIGTVKGVIASLQPPATPPSPPAA